MPQQISKPPDTLRRQLIRPEADHPPTGERGFQVFFQVGGETRAAIVAPMHVDAALDFNQGPARKVGEVGPPLANRVEAEFLFQHRSTQRPPQ